MREEQVLGLQITMDDAAGVRRRESARHLYGAIEGLARSQRAVTQAGAQCFALEKLGHDVRHIALAPDVVDDQQIGMIKGAGRPCLGLEPPDAVGVSGDGASQRLDRDVASQPRVASAIDLAHAASADQTIDLVGTQPRAGSERVAHAVSL